MDSKASLLVLVLVFAQTSCFHLANNIKQQCDCQVVVTSRATLIEDLRENTQNSKCLESCARLEDVLDRIEQGGQTTSAPNPGPSSGSGCPGSCEFIPAASCAEILRNDPNAESGFYWIDNERPTRQYCDMTRSCNGTAGGWMRVAQLDMRDEGQQCPSGLRQRMDDGMNRTCGIDSNGGVCSTVIFPVEVRGYSQVCGKINAFQFGSPDAFRVRDTNIRIDQNYVDGISLTEGDPMRHVWTFAAALDEVGTNPRFNCPCTNTNQEDRAGRPPAFVGDDYFCDTGSAERWRIIFYGDDPLWDGSGCGPDNTCCSFNNPPWFYKDLSYTTSTDIEMRVCRNEGSGNEDIAIRNFEIYVQ